MRRREPRPLGPAVAALADRLAPLTPLAEVQRVWGDAVGEVVAAQAEPTGEHEGVLVVTCASAVWAQELDLMAPDVIARVNALLGTPSVRALRCRTTAAKGWGKERAEPGDNR
jgi:predicted nucleic acid-binding Zn ribbon protein